MYKETFGEVIRDARKSKGISLREMARRINVSHPYLSQLENGHNSNPSLNIIQKLSSELGISFIYLVYLSDTEIGFGIKELPKVALDIFKILTPSDFEKLDSYEEFKKHSTIKVTNEEKGEENPNSISEDLLFDLYQRLKRLRDIELNAQINAKLEDALSDINKDDEEQEMLLNTIKNVPKINKKAFVNGLPIPVYVDEDNNVNIQIIKNDSYLNDQDMKELNSMIKGFLYNKKFIKPNL